MRLNDEMKFLDSNGVVTLWNKIKNSFVPLVGGGTLTLSGTDSLKVSIDGGGVKANTTLSINCASHDTILLQGNEVGGAITMSIASDNGHPIIQMSNGDKLKMLTICPDILAFEDGNPIVADKAISTEWLNGALV